MKALIPRDPLVTLLPEETLYLKLPRACATAELSFQAVMSLTFLLNDTFQSSGYTGALVTRVHFRDSQGLAHF